MDKDLKKTIRNIYIMLCAILCLTIICSTAILSYVFFHWNDKMKNNIKENINYEYDISEFKKMSYNEFVTKYNSKEKIVIFIGRKTCIHCANFIPVLKEAQHNYNYQTYYLDISKITNRQNKEIKKLDKFLNDNFGSTPMVIITENGKINENGKLVGETSYEEFSEFLNKNGYKKKN